jgi:uncharacterized repeat protein (TIGR01451 family)
LLSKLDARRKRLNRQRFAIVVAASAGLLGTPVNAEPPPLPASFYGAVQVDGAPAPAGGRISARLAGIELTAAETFVEEGEGRFRLHVPGDRFETLEIEGPVAEQAFEIRLGELVVATPLWRSGSYERLDLSTAGGPDLAVEIDDGVQEARASDTLDVVITVRNFGPGASGSVLAEVLLPPGVELVGASDGGTLTDTTLAWSAFELEAEEVARRSFRAAVGASFAAGVEELTWIARVRDDSSGGLDPDPTNNQAVDSDRLDAAPDFAVELSDGRDEVRPGESLTYRARVVNQGTQGGTGALLVVDLPAAGELVAASLGGVEEGGTLAWPLFELAAGAESERSFTWRLPLELDALVQTLTALARVVDDGTNGPEASLADNEALDLDTILHAPDLLVPEIGVEGLVTDTQSLAVSGTVDVALANRGTLPAAPFTVVVFADLDGDGDFSPADLEIGRELHPGLAAGESDVLPVAANGMLRFRGEAILAMADAERVIDELDETNNVGDSARRCVAAPAGPFAPAVEWRWPPPEGASRYTRAIDSLSTPIVVHLTDDNGDGLFDERDVPSIVLVTTDLVYTLEPMVALRALRGDTGESLWDVNGIYPQPFLPLALSFSGLAAGDIDGDGKPEIVSTTFIADNRLIAFEHTGAMKWQSQSYRTHPVSGRSTRSDNPTIADLDGDGRAEIVVGANVFDRNGKLLWRGKGGHAFQSAGNNEDHRSGAISVVADVDLDGKLEVVTGNTLYRWNGEIVWQVDLPDGFPAVADFDDDPYPEIVVVSRGTVRLHDDDGSLIWGPVPLPGSDPKAGGAPTVGDFDGNGRPEIGVASSDVYVVFDTDGSILWQTPTQDYTSNFTGSTLFDFDGDGAMEVVYRDERHLWIFRGGDGTVLYKLPVSSDTWTEQPIVADVDGDGQAEIVVSSDRALDVAIPAGGRTAGLFVIGAGDGDWVAARGLWNQHAYVPELVADDAGIPAQPERGWLTHNSFRANLPPETGAFAAPDLTAGRITFDLAALPRVGIGARIGNAGRAPVALGVAVAFYTGNPAAGGELLGTLRIERRLLPGDFVDVRGDFELPLGASAEIRVVADDDGTGAGRENECDETNNLAVATLDLASLGLWLTLDNGTDGVGAGDELTYLLRVRNAFAGTATGVRLVDELPAELRFVAASDGGSEAGGFVSWPEFSLASGELAERRLTVRVDPDLPLVVRSITNLALVEDDGALGPDPTPENNVAIDVDAVLTATALAGGPYTANEGEVFRLDGSASFDRDGELVAWEWDLDGDGAFVDASGPTVLWSFAQQGVYPVALRVRDDSGEVDVDRTTATILNVPPTVSAPAVVTCEEGRLLELSGVLVHDPGALDPLVATIDWGDGTVEGIAVASGNLAASHRYLDDGDYPVLVCVADGDGGEGCAALTATIANVAPEVQQSLRFDLLGWDGEELPGSSTVQWLISDTGATAIETKNGGPTLLVGSVPAFGVHEFAIRVAQASDDDFFGFALGYEPGDLARPEADYLLVDWKGGNQSGARVGLALSRVHGVPLTGELWQHADFEANGGGNRVVELARAASLGAKSWRRYTDHRFRVDYGPGRVRAWVDGALELDFAGELPAGRLAFYNYSQSNVVYTPLETTIFVAGYEGGPAALRALFTDPGVLDTHAARVDWGDGASEAVAHAFEEGRGEVVAAHVYADDGELEVELCVADDDGGEGCAAIPARILNLPPALAFDLVSTGYLPDPVHLGSTAFTDPGILDLHSARVDWGDGSVEEATVAESGGSGTVAASHFYAAPGTYSVELCVDDGDGGVVCDARTLTVVEPFLDLAVTKTANRNEARPGQQVVYTLKVENRGTLPASGVVLTDRLPEHLEFVSATDGGIFADGAVTWSFPSLSSGQELVVELSALVATAASAGSVIYNFATIEDDGQSGADSSPENNTASISLRLGDLETPVVLLPVSIDGVEGGVVTLAGASYEDTSLNESHSARVDWGDGTSSSASLSPSTGTSGKINASHTYIDDGTYTIEVCVRDAAAHVGCAATVARIANVSPEVVDPGVVTFQSWKSETYPSNDVAPLWIVSATGLSVLQDTQCSPSIFFGPIPVRGMVVEGTLRVEPAWDDDYIGIVLGFKEGDIQNPDAEYLLVDWKAEDQTSARRGLAVSRVFGIPRSGELWGHTNIEANGLENGVEELARGFTRSRSRWVNSVDYRFRIEYSATRMRLWVNGTLEFDLTGSFPDGHFGFYAYSQHNVRFRGFLYGISSINEGESHEVIAPFGDPGVLDTHRAEIGWGDGSFEAFDAESEGRFGTVTAAHTYLDDGEYPIEVCVTDNAGDSDCGVFPLIVLNVAPTVVAGPDAAVSAGVATAFALATFTDPGVLDVHSARVDWGDGGEEEAELVEDGGAGEVFASHAYAAPGLYTVTICVADDDGGEGCDTLRIAVGSELPALVAPKTVAPVDRDGDGVVSPGDDLLYEIEIVNLGPTAATGVVLTDPIPAHTTLLPESVSPEGLVTGLDPLTVEIPSIPAGAAITVRFAVRIDPVLPAGVREIVNSGTVTSAELPPVATDDPALPGPADPTRIPVQARALLTFVKRAEVFDQDGNGAATAGDEILWNLRVANDGTTDADALLLRDVIPEATELVAGTIASEALVTREEPLEVLIDRLPVGESVELAFRTRIVDPLPRTVTGVANQAELFLDEIAAQLSDDPATPEPGDPTGVPVAPIPDLSVEPASALEGSSGFTPLRFRLTLDVPTVFPVAISWSTADGTALAGEDYVAAAGVTTFAPGETEAWVEVQVIGDGIVEGDETLLLQLADPVHLRPRTLVTIGTILDDDRTFLGISDAAADEGEPLEFLVTLSAPTALGAAVDWTTADGSARAGEDYVVAAGRLLFAPFEVSRTIIVETVDDAEFEGEETFWLLLSKPLGAELARAEGIGTIRDDDDALLAIEDAELLEGDEGTAPMTFTVTLSTPRDVDVLVDYETVAESATADADFLSTAGTLTLPAGETSASLAVGIVGDRYFEGNETFRVELSNPVGAALAEPVGVGTILDDDLCRGPDLLVNGGAEHLSWTELFPGWSAPDGSRWERRTSNPQPAEGRAFFDAADRATAELAQTVDLAPLAARIDAGGLELALSGWLRTGDEPPSDLARVVAELRDEHGELLEVWDTGALAAIGEWSPFDATREVPPGARALRLRLVALRSAGTSLDAYFDGLAVEPLGLPLLAVDDVEVFEAPGVEALFTASLSCPLEREVTFGFATADGSARAGEDYLPTAGGRALAPGELATTIAVPILDDDVVEPTERLTLELFDADGAELLDPRGRGTIRDGDGCQGSSGYWKRHPALWPTRTLVIGGALYDEAGIRALLEDRGKNPPTRVAAQLVATLFNLLIGTDPWILPVVARADAFLALHPPGTPVAEPERIEAEKLTETLDAYNTSCPEK